MTTKAELTKARDHIEQLVIMALDAATSLEQVVECARAAAAIGTPSLLHLVADRLIEEIDRAEASSSAWEAELLYSKLDAWQQTGHKARLLAEAWTYIRPLLDEPTARPRRRRDPAAKSRAVSARSAS